MTRPKVSVALAVTVAIRQAESYGTPIRCVLCNGALRHDEPRILEHLVPRKLRIQLGLDPDAIDILAYVHKACADAKTNGNKATCADGDLHKLAKADRIAGGGKKVRHPMPKHHRPMPKRADPWGKEWRAKQ